MILQQEEPDDYVLATGEMYSVREFVELSFSHIGRTLAWRGKGADEVGLDERTGQDLVRVDPRYFRPTEVDQLLGDPTKARRRLGWAHKTSFKDLVAETVASDIDLVKRETWRNDRSAG